MKFTLSWLKDHLETDAPLETIVERLTAIGFRPLDMPILFGGLSV